MAWNWIDTLWLYVRNHHLILKYNFLSTRASKILLHKEILKDIFVLKRIELKYSNKKEQILKYNFLSTQASKILHKEILKIFCFKKDWADIFKYSNKKEQILKYNCSFHSSKQDIT